MNMKDMILNELSKDDYKDDFVKIRYIYLIVCNTFTYDMRFIYTNNLDLKNEIYNKDVKLDNVEDYEIVCYSFAKVLCEALSLYGLEAKIEREKSDSDFRHVYVIVKCNGSFIKLDPTKRHDSTRVKLNSSTLDFTNLDSSKQEYFDNKLKEADSIINSNRKNKVDIEVYFNDEKITELINLIEDEARRRKTSDSELFFEKFGYITGLVNVRDDLTRYDDMDYYYSYLIRKFNLNKEEKQYVKPGIFFKNDDETMKDIINITLVEYKKFPPRFYVMRKVDGNYKIKELEKDETIELLKEYNCPVIQYYFEERTTKMIDNRISRIIK